MTKDRTIPDPILQKATKEIADICDKYDIGGYMILASRTHGEYLLHFPQWSKAILQTNPDGSQGIRFKAKGKDEDKTVRDTVHMIQVFEVHGFNLYKGMENLLEMLESKMFITGGPKKL